MDAKEIRMRCIEAVSHSGIREPSRVTKDAKVLEEWVLAAEDKPTAPKRKGPNKAADKE